MKHQMSWLATALAITLLFAACPASAAEAPAITAAESLALRDGITWDTTLEQLQEIEGTGADDTALLFGEQDGFAEYDVQDVPLGGELTDLMYYFHSGQLLLVCYFVLQPDEGTYSALYEAVSGEYGEAANADMAAARELMNGVAPDSVAPGDITEAAGWRLSDGTPVFLIQAFGSCYLLYFHEARIFSLEWPEEETAVSVPAAMQTFVFHNGVTWDTTLEQLQEIEGAEDETDGQLYEQDDITAYLTNSAMPDGEAKVTYMYRQGRLLLIVYAYPDDGEEAFDTRYADLTTAYGAATEFDAEKVENLFLTAVPWMSREDVAITSIAGWVFGDGTLFCLAMIDGDTGFIIFNELEILSMSESQTAAE